MSKLILKGHNAARFELNVTQFRSPMAASISSAQTRNMMHHFPIRAGQPDIQFTVQFRSIDDKHKFQDFVRDHQRNALSDKYASATVSGGKVTLLWPERNIDNWTGYIVSMPIQEARFQYAPRVTFGVALLDSLMSERTFNASLGNDFWTVLGQEIAAYIPDATSVEAAFQMPTLPATVTQQIVDTTTQAVNSIVYSMNGNQRINPGIVP
jgi:hypothetical protein